MEAHDTVEVVVSHRPQQSDLTGPLEDRKCQRVADAENRDDDRHTEQRVDEVQECVDLLGLVGLELRLILQRPVRIVLQHPLEALLHGRDRYAWVQLDQNDPVGGLVEVGVEGGAGDAGGLDHVFDGEGGVVMVGQGRADPRKQAATLVLDDVFEGEAVGTAGQGIGRGIA